MAMGDSTNKGRRIRHIPDDRSRPVSGARRTDDTRRRSTSDESAPVVDRGGETVIDVVDLLDAMFTDDESAAVSRLLTVARAADEIVKLRIDVEETKILLADAQPRIVEDLLIKAENRSLRMDVDALIKELDILSPIDRDLTFP